MNEQEKLQNPDHLSDASEVFPDNLYRETFQERALARSAVNRVLLNTRLGHRLINGGVFTHPVISERNRQSEKLEHLVLSYEKTGMFDKAVDLRKIALQDPDMQPLPTPTTATLELELEKERNSFFYERLALNQFDSVKDFDFRIPLPEYQNFSGLSDEIATQSGEVRAQLQEVLNGQFNCSLRNKVLELVTSQYWHNLIELILHLHAIPQLKTELNRLIKMMAPKLFKNPAFREQLTCFMIRRVCIMDFAGHDNLARFFNDLGFPEITEKEKSRFVYLDYLERSMENSWDYNQEKYFQVIIFLYQYGFLDQQFFLENVKFRKRVIEFSLKALRKNQNFRTFQKVVKPLVVGFGLFEENDLSLYNQGTLYTAYQHLCHSHNLLPDREVSALFRRPNHAQKWEE